ncbi:MAG: hypothetical protein A2W31_01820 [Planctomycetes bacterium RBG_16_64_10]|nr:MAG: hypothetical protein A2W31_01820 [Planctomycetes bacterium RBG_16_64_10]
MLAGALVVLGEVVRLASQCAAETEAVTRAQLLAASKLAELTAQITPLEPVQNIAFPNDPDWVYSITTAPTDQPGMIAVQVEVSQDARVAQQRVACTLVRWMLDPRFSAAEPPEEENEAVGSQPATGGQRAGTTGSPG